MTDLKIDKIIRSRRRTISLCVSADATLTVRAPRFVSLDYIKTLVFKKRFWILKKKEQVLRRGVARQKEFVEGEEFFYLGKSYKLKISDCDRISVLDELYFPEKYLGHARARMVRWYKEETREIVAERAKFFSQATGWKYKSISVTGAMRRWGSCSHKDSVNFSWRLAMIPREVIDYVVAHELAHIPEKNHSARFWSKVGAIMPDYKIRRRWLRENEGKLKI